MKKYTNFLLKLEKEHAGNLASLADKIRTELIIPICDKYSYHGLSFFAGMGAWAFSYRDDLDEFCSFSEMDGIGWDWEASEESEKVGGDLVRLEFEGIKEILDLLETEISSISQSDCLGLWIHDYNSNQKGYNKAWRVARELADKTGKNYLIVKKLHFENHEIDCIEEHLFSDDFHFLIDKIEPIVEGVE